MHYDWGQAAAKKERGYFKQRTSNKNLFHQISVIGAI